MNLETIKLITGPILRRHGVVKAAIFGSLARGDQHPDSDVDILVEYARDKAVSLFDHIALTEELETVLKCNVDLITTNSLSPYIKDTVLNEMRPIL